MRVPTNLRTGPVDVPARSCRKRRRGPKSSHKNWTYCGGTLNVAGYNGTAVATSPSNDTQRANTNTTQAAQLIADSYQQQSGTTATASATTTTSVASEAITLALVPTSSTNRLGYTGQTDVSSITQNTSGATVGTSIPLPGETTYSTSPNGTTYTYANGHGDTIETTNNTGTRTWTGYWGPYGETPPGITQPSDTAIVGGSYGYNGQQGKLTDGNLVLMGARPYEPTDGRFTQPDPIEGGCSNDYTYGFGDPLNHPDLSGQGFGWHSITHFVSKRWRRYLCIGLEGAALGLAGAAIVASGGSAALALSAASILAGTIAPLLVHNKAGFEDALVGDAGGLLAAGIVGGAYAGLAGRLSGGSAGFLRGLSDVSNRVMGIPGIADSYASSSKGPCG